MQIKRLIVRKTLNSSEVIRNIKFQNGLNLILDETVNASKKTGNSVGKSTAVKIIDLCLGAKSPSYLYKDPETKAENNLIKMFLETNRVEAELILGDKNNTTSIVRPLYLRGKRFINDDPYDKTGFEQELKKIGNGKLNYP